MVLFCIPCLALILYFLVVSLFVPRYRVYIKEAWICFLEKLRGKKCPVSFDKKMHHAFVMWLTKKNWLAAARFFHKKRNFDIGLVVFLTILTVVSTWLLWLLFKFLFIQSPCEGSTQPVCTGLPK
jgi:hypothetical protein